MSGGDNYGAIRIVPLERFYDAQRSAAESIIRGVHNIVCKTFETSPRMPDRPVHRLAAPIGSDPRDYDRPHHTFTIDGPRGSGKTTLLQTLASYLSLMRVDCSSIAPNGDDEWTMYNELKELSLRTPTGAGSQKSALVLPIVFTEDMGPTESAMEAVFAQLELRLEEALTSDTDRKPKDSLEELKRKLRREVGVAWTFSQQIGAEALSQDALDYDDFVDRRAGYNRRAYNRIGAWRRFIDTYLDTLGYQLLIPLFDDSDLNPQVAQDILRSIRMYFSHPRIVTILAVEIRNLNWTILTRELASEREALRSLQLISNVHLESYYRQIENNVEALVEKVLPINLRYNLRAVSFDYVDHFFKRGNPALTGQSKKFDDWCRQQFLAIKDRDPRQNDRFAWFLLPGPYRRLVGDNVRQLIAFRDATDQPDAKPLEALLQVHQLRSLADQISYNPTNLVKIIENKQILTWPQENDEENEEYNEDAKLTEHEIQFVDLWVDINFAKPHLDLQGLASLRNWLPRPPLHEGSQIELRDLKRLGVAGMFGNTLLPRSCLYVHQLRRLSGVIFEALPQPTSWALWLGGWELGDDEERLRRLRDAAARVAKIAKVSDHETLVWLGARISVLQRGRFLQPRASHNAPRSDVQALEREATAFAVALFAAAQPSVRNYVDFGKRLVEVAESSSDGGELLAFMSRLADVGRLERLRQEAVFIWSAALEIAKAGEDDRRVARPQPRSELTVPPVATSEEPRFPELVEQTARALEVGGRHALLLAWSICPLLRPLHDFGVDYTYSPATAESWAKLAKAYREMLTGLRKTIPSAFVLSAAERKRSASDADALSWTYADFKIEDLKSIITDLKSTEAAFSDSLKPDAAAGVLSMETLGTSWPRDPAGLMAAVLGTSRRWAQDNLVTKT